jgi:hypothetical protein
MTNFFKRDVMEDAYQVATGVATSERACFHAGSPPGKFPNDGD